jgi:LPS-assembly lipoprotein
MIARRRLLAVLIALSPPLAGCGWEPLYADRATEPASAELRAVRVAPIAERYGQNLERGLRQSFNPNDISTPQKYVLKVAESTSVVDLGIGSQGLGTRGEINYIANYQLVDVKTNTVLQTGVVHTTDSFDIQANGYSTIVAQNDAYTRAVEEVRREITARLTLFFQNKVAAPS